MRNLLFLALAFTCLCMSPSVMSPSPSQWIQIRNAYRAALIDNNQVTTFETVCKSHGQTDAVAKAYYATALALRARASISPTTKLSLANQAQTLLNSAAISQPQNLEIRFLRYSFEYGTPAFVNMKKNMQADKPLAIKFARSSSPIKDIAVNFFRECTELSETEKRDIK